MACKLSVLLHLFLYVVGDNIVVSRQCGMTYGCDCTQTNTGEIQMICSGIDVASIPHSEGVQQEVHIVRLFSTFISNLDTLVLYSKLTLLEEEDNHNLPCSEIYNLQKLMNISIISGCMFTSQVTQKLETSAASEWTTAVTPPPDKTVYTHSEEVSKLFTSPQDTTFYTHPQTTNSTQIIKAAEINNLILIATTSSVALIIVLLSSIGIYYKCRRKSNNDPQLFEMEDMYIDDIAVSYV